MQSNYTRPSKQTADGFGGEINNLITNQYEKDFLESKEFKYKANISIQKRRLMALLGSEQNLYETNSSKLRKDSIHKKLKIIKLNERKKELFSPSINPPLK